MELGGVTRTEQRRSERENCFGSIQRAEEASDRMSCHRNEARLHEHAFAQLVSIRDAASCAQIDCGALVCHMSLMSCASVVGSWQSP